MFQIGRVLPTLDIHTHLIAVVDDEPSIRVALRRLLQSAGFVVDTFGSGSEFLASLGTNLPDCVVLDLHMPNGNGFAVQAGLVERGLHLPVVVITGHDDAMTSQRALAGGAAAYLRKPVDDQALLQAITQATASARPEAKVTDAS